jgi:tryptophanyl-tRNA synthetase
MKKVRIFSGARPTGRQHIGNYLGALQNWVRLQDEYDCIYCIVDIHALTSLEDTSRLQENIREMMLDWLAVGLDPEKSIMFVQSHVPEVMELHTLLSMITPLSWLLRVPTFKEKVKLQPENVNYGLVGYPVLMTSDIVLYKATVVPVGEDQLPHLELTREIARRFNSLFGNTFPEPQAKMTSYPLVVGLDGKGKMSKQAGNDIEIAMSEKETIKKISTAYTDPARRYRADPGHPTKCNVYKLLGYFDDTLTKDVAARCKKADIGCVDCKMLLAETINKALKPVRQRRAELAADSAYINKVFTEGAERARVIAQQTLKEVKRNMNLI